MKIKKVEHRGKTYWTVGSRPQRLRCGTEPFDWIDMPAPITSLESHQVGLIIRFGPGLVGRLEGVGPSSWCLRYDIPEREAYEPAR